MMGESLMNRREWTTLAVLAALFAGVYMLPIGSETVEAAVGEGLRLTQWYAREHVILCLLPAFLIAGAIGAFVDKASVLKYLGPGANKPMAYGVGAASGCVLAVCSCTVLPLFAGIYRMGAGLGPATAFLFAGPAINVLAIILTARVLGVEVGIARGVGAVGFSLLIGLIMATLFESRRPGADGERPVAAVLPEAATFRPLHQFVALFGLMIAVLVFANWGSSPDASGIWHLVHVNKWRITIVASLLLWLVLWRWFRFPLPALLVAGVLVGVLGVVLGGHPSIPFLAGMVALCLIMPRAGEQGREWWTQTWSCAKLITPLLIGGVFIAGLLLGSPGHSGLVPSGWVERAVGGNGFGANMGAAVAGAFMYFATLTEVPIVQGLVGSGMGKGPALSLLLAGPALSLPSMLVIRGVLGTRRTAAYVAVVIVGSCLIGYVFGSLG